MQARSVPSLAASAPSAVSTSGFGSEDEATKPPVQGASPVPMYRAVFSSNYIQLDVVASISMALMTFGHVMEHVAQAFEVLGVLVLALGTVWSFIAAALTWRRSGQAGQAYPLLRRALGGALLLGLEILVAADLVRTIAVAPTVANVLVLGLIVVIRTFLSFSLEIEISGRPPWRRVLTSGATAIRQASASIPAPGAAPDQPAPGRPGA